MDSDECGDTVAELQGGTSDSQDPEVKTLAPSESFAHDLQHALDDIHSPTKHEDDTTHHDSGRCTPCSLTSSGEWFDADSEPPPSSEEGGGGASAAVDQHVFPSPSRSVAAAGGHDPADVEEEADLEETDDMHDVVTSNWTIIMHILSQVRIGMDLTRFALPVFFLEKRSLLQMYAEFFAHPDMLTNVTHISDAKGRMVEVVRWFLSSISASRKGVDPKKPYNPILGETFQCYWDIPPDGRLPDTDHGPAVVETGPVPYAGSNSLAFVAEQVSHHPPVSAFYAECPSKRVYINGTVGTKTKFLGLSVKAQNTGSLSIYYMDHGEEYVTTLPSGYVRSLLMSPWFEFGGECTVSCAKSGYVANIEFHTKPFRGGKRHRVTAEVKHESEKKPLVKMEGEWNNVVHVKPNKSDIKRKEVFTDASKVPTIRKKVKTLSAVDPCDSRAVWRHVTEAMVRGDAEAASEAKYAVEEKQRAEVRERQRTGEEWQQKLFSFNGDANRVSWMYNSPLSQRLSTLT